MKKHLLEVMLYLWLIGMGVVGASYRWLAWIGLAALVWKGVRLWRGSGHSDAFKASQFQSTQFKDTKTPRRRGRK